MTAWVGCRIMCCDNIPHRGPCASPTPSGPWPPLPISLSLVHEPGPHLPSWPTPHNTFLSLDPPGPSYSVTVSSNFLPHVPCANRHVAIVNIMAVPVSLSCCVPDQHVLPGSLDSASLIQPCLCPVTIWPFYFSSYHPVICHRSYVSVSYITKQYPWGQCFVTHGHWWIPVPIQCLAHDR